MINFLGILFADTKMNLIIYFYETIRLYITDFFLILPFCVHAKKAVFGYSGSYWEGYSLEEVNINEYKKLFFRKWEIEVICFHTEWIWKKKMGIFT